MPKKLQIFIKKLFMLSFRKWAHELLRNSKILAITITRAGGVALSRLPERSTDHPLWQNSEKFDEIYKNKRYKSFQIINIMPGDLVIVWKDHNAKKINSRNWFMAEVGISLSPTKFNQRLSKLKVVDIETGVSSWVEADLAQKVVINQISPALPWCAN